MADDSDAVLLITGKTPKIEETQRRYIEALENRISFWKSQPQNNSSSDVGPQSLTNGNPPDAKPPPSSSSDTVKNSSNKTNASEDSGKTHNSKSLKNLACVQSYSRFFKQVKVVARRYSKNNDSKKEKPVGDEEVISDVELKTTEETTTQEDKSAEHAQQNAAIIAPITFTLGIDESDCLIKATAKINDPELQALLQIFFAHYPGFGPDLAVFSIDSPFEPFVQHWWDLQALLRGEEEHTAVVKFQERLHRFRKTSHTFTGWPKRLQDFLNCSDGLRRTVKNLGILLELVHEAIITRSGEQSLTRILEEDVPMSQKVVSFETLWTIFKPGDIVISTPVFDEPQAFIVRESVESNLVKEEATPYWSLICWAYDWTGKTFGRVSVDLRIPIFRGVKKPQTLSVYPKEFLSPEEEEKLVQRGQRFRDICLKPKGSRLFQYSGDAILRANGIGKVHLKSVLDNDQDFSRSSPFQLFEQLLRRIIHGEDFSNTTTVEIDGAEQVMVDASSFRLHGPGKHYQDNSFMPMGKIRFYRKPNDCRCSICQQNVALDESQRPSYDMETNSSTDEFGDLTQYLICPPRVLGYHLAKKRWVELKVSNVQDVAQRVDMSAFENLQMDSVKSKELLRKLVVTHWSKKRSDHKGKMQDFMKGKGESLVILLYGPPGVGKTLTAESVALVTGQPLLFVSVADIGLNPEEIEENLIHVFRLAASWEAIILFDEADVFLESRSGDTASLERNALVSELLRVLEYYDGILILTTNRLRRFDHAVMSRVNLAIKYPELSHAQKKNIFLHFIGQLDENEADLVKIEAWIKDEEGREQLDGLNGRQIRNILFSAAKISLEYDGGKLSLDAIKQLAHATKRFSLDIRADMVASRIKNEPGDHTM